MRVTSSAPFGAGACSEQNIRSEAAGPVRAVRGKLLYLRLAVAGVTAAIILFAFSISQFAAYWPDYPLGTDFVSYWTGASLVHEGAGQDLYDMELQRGFQERLLAGARTDEMRNSTRLDPYHSPPPLALLFIPLTLLPPSWAYLLWSGLNLLALLGVVAIALRGFSGARLAATLMLTFGAVFDNLIWGQVDALFLLTLALSLRSQASNRPYVGGAFLGLLWLKPQYAALFALVFLVKRRWRELAGMSFAGLAVGVASWMMIGTEGILRYLDVLRRIGAYYPPSGSLISPEIMINWRSTLMKLLPGIPENEGSFLVVVLGVATGMSALLVLRGEWAPSSPRFARQMLVITLATLVAAPHSHLHGAVLLLAPLSLALSRGGVETPGSRIWPPMMALGYGLGLLGWPFPQFRWLLAPYFLAAMALLIVQDRRRCACLRVCLDRSLTRGTRCG